MFQLNFGLKPVFGFKPWFQTLVLTKDKVTQCVTTKRADIRTLYSEHSLTAGRGPVYGYSPRCFSGRG